MTKENEWVIRDGTLAVEAGDWVECLNGYGIVVKVFPEYYEHGEDDIPEGKKIGDRRQYSLIVKRFCSYDFKIYPQTLLNSEGLIGRVSASNLKKVKKLLEDPKVAARFEKYKVLDLCGVNNIDFTLPDEKIEQIERGLAAMKDNGNLSMTVREIEAYLKKEFDLELLSKKGPKGWPNCYIQLLTVGFGVYRDKQSLYKKIGINRHPDPES